MIINYCKVCKKHIGYHSIEDAICGECLNKALIEEIESEELPDSSTEGNE